MKHYKGFEKSSDIVAKELLGKKLLTKIDNKITGGIIVETESYEGFQDPASHGFIGKTERNKPIFEHGGIVYVYLIYGKFYLLNIVTSVKDFPSSVFIRAIEPTDGIDIMKKRRNSNNILNLTNGPAKLTIALGIDNSFNFLKINKDKIFILENGCTKQNITQTTRVGISKGKELLKRFYIKGNKWISKK
jgi:DNA-3-methyladenine glycosylase